MSSQFAHVFGVVLPAELDRAVSSAATFSRLVMPGHLFVANPLDDGFFRREMAGHTAIIRAEI